MRPDLSINYMTSNRAESHNPARLLIPFCLILRYHLSTQAASIDSASPNIFFFLGPFDTYCPPWWRCLMYMVHCLNTSLCLTIIKVLGTNGVGRGVRAGKWEKHGLDLCVFGLSWEIRARKFVSVFRFFVYPSVRRVSMAFRGEEDERCVSVVCP